MEPAIQFEGVRVFHGDCRDVLATLPDNSVDSVVTDPPYELGFMGKKWDSSGIAYDLTVWRECLRVLKPGGHLLAFGGSRTWHRLAVAIEDAGFELRDSIAWLYGSGFPKSLDVSKAIDKRGGAVAGFENFRDAVKAAMKANGISRSALQEALGNFMLSHYLTAGSQPAIPNWRDYQVIRDTVGLGEKFDDLFRPESEREVIGQRKQRANGADSKIPMNASVSDVEILTAPATSEAKAWEGWGTALKPAFEPVVVGRKPLGGKTVAENVLRWGVGGLNIDGSRVAGEVPSVPQPALGVKERIVYGFGTGTGRNGELSSAPNGRWPANVILDEVTAGLLDEQSGCETSRFFYCAKASKRDRNEGLEGLNSRTASDRPGDVNSIVTRHSTITKNFHPTVKPTALMRYLVKLVTPPGGVVLDPFTGSGSTGKAAILEGFEFVGAELTEDYLPIIEGRLRWALDNREDGTLF